MWPANGRAGKERCHPAPRLSPVSSSRCNSQLSNCARQILRFFLNDVILIKNHLPTPSWNEGCLTCLVSSNLVPCLNFTCVDPALRSGMRRRLELCWHVRPWQWTAQSFFRQSANVELQMSPSLSIQDENSRISTTYFAWWSLWRRPWKNIT